MAKEPVDPNAALQTALNRLFREPGLSWEEYDAQDLARNERQRVARERRELTAGLAALNWTHRRLGTGREGVLPARDRNTPCRNPAWWSGVGWEYRHSEKREHA